MKNAIILHGMVYQDEYLNKEIPTPSNNHFIPWLQKNLLLHNIISQAPELPKPYEPVYEEWKEVFEQFEINEETILIGHSCGAGFIVRWLSENNIKVDKVILVGPWMDPDKELKSDFFDFKINLENQNIIVIYSLDDGADVLKSVNELKLTNPDATFLEFTDKGHFTLEDLGTEEFPELLNAVLDDLPK